MLTCGQYLTVISIVFANSETLKYRLLFKHCKITYEINTQVHCRHGKLKNVLLNLMRQQICGSPSVKISDLMHMMIWSP